MKSKSRKIVNIALSVLFVLSAAFALVACGKNNAGNGVTVTLVSETYEATSFTLKEGDDLPTVEVAERDFEGYWTDPAYLTKYEGTTVPDHSVTLYYKQNYQYYTVNLDFGDYGVNTLTARRGVSEALPDSSALGTSAVGFADVKGGDIKYALGTESNKIYNLAPKNGEVTLYAVYEINDVNDYVIENGVVTAYNGNKTRLVLPYGATKVAAGALKDNKTVTSVTVPSTYTSVGKGAFEGCEKLETLTVPFIGGTRTSNRFLAYVFGADKYENNDFSFAAYVMNKSLYMGDRHFENQYLPLTLKTVRVNSPINEFAEGAFYKAYALENVVLDYPAALNRVGDYAFAYCPALGKKSDVNFPISFDWLSEVSEIGKYAFATYTGNYTTDVKEIYPAGEAMKDTYTATLYASPYPFTNLTDIPELTNVKTIEDSAFYFCYAIKDVKFGNELETVEMNAFYYCATHTSLTFPESLKSIGEYAFFSNSSVLTIDFGTDIRFIGTRAFAFCGALSQVTFTGEDAPVTGNQAFCNALTSYTNPTDGSTEYEMVFDDLRIYAPANGYETYCSSLAAYKDYLTVADTSASPAYWYDKNGNLTTKFEFTSGGIVNVTDKGQAFISSVDYWNFGQPTYSATCGESYPMMYEFVDEETYNLTAGKHNKPLYANQKVVRVWHPDLISYTGAPLDTLYFLITEFPHEIDGKTYLLPTMVQTVGADYGGRDYGDVNVARSYVASVNRYGAVRIGRATKESGIPVVMWMDDPEGTYYMSFEKAADHEFRAIYYNDKYEVIRTDVYRSLMNGNTESIGDPLYLVSDDETVLFEANSLYNNGNELYLNGIGGAKIKIGSDTYKVGKTANVAGATFGEEGFTVLLSDIEKNGVYKNGLTGTVTFSKLAVNGDYLAIDVTIGDDASYKYLNVTSDSGWYRWGYGEFKSVKYNYPKKNSDITVDDWRYKLFTDVEIGNSIILYVYAPDGKKDAPEYAYFREYEKNTMVGCGEVTYRKNGTMNFKYGDGDVRQARKLDKRGSFQLDNATGSEGYRNFVYYDDSEDMTLNLVENYYGYSLYYYTVKTDGYGNMYILDQHDDGFDDAYVGTYDDYNSFTANGTTYYELIFKGKKLDETTNTTVGEEKTFWILYAFSSLAAYSDDNDDAQWYGTLAGIYTDHGDKNITAYDEFGYKEFDINVDVYGNVSYKRFTHTATINGNVVYTEIESGEVARLVSVMSSDGDVAYFIAIDKNGNCLFTLRRYDTVTGDAYFVFAYDAKGIKISVDVENVNVEIDVTKLKQL